MNAKQKLNNEIILCRGAVRKAKVDVTRKIIKTMKILKSCKKDNLKEKKLRKSERLFHKIQIIKKLKLDKVTKFALINNLENYVPSGNNEENVMALLGKYKSIAQKIKKIRAQFSDWKTEIPALLDAMEKKKLSHSIRKTDFNKTKAIHFKSNNEEPETESKETNNNNENLIKEIKNSNINKIIKNEKPDFQINVKQDQNKKSSVDIKVERKSNKTFELPDVKIEKIADPFFLQKEMVAPKLLPENELEISEQKPLKNSFWGKNMPQKMTLPAKKKNFSIKLDKGKKLGQEEKLHPSWVAKKVQLIKPFEGKKIKFSED